MAHSYLEYADHHQSFNDAKLRSVALFTAKFVRDNKIEKFKTVAEEWEKNFEWFPPGAIDLRLNDFFPSSRDIKDFSMVMREVKEDLRKYGEHIPEDSYQKIIKANWSSPGDGIKTSIVERNFDEVISFIDSIPV